jgi:PPE family
MGGGGNNNSGYPMMCRNWLAIPHQQLYDDIHTGPGVDGTRSTQDTYARIGALFARVDGDIRTGLTQLGVAYEGEGSQAAQSGISVLQQWTVDAQTGSTLASSAVGEQATGYAVARDTMPEPVQITAQDGFFDKVYDFFGGTTAREEQEAQAREAHIRAAQVMSDYDIQSGNAASSMPVFVAPPPVTVDVPAPQTQSASIQQPGAGVTQQGGPSDNTGTNDPGATPVSQTPQVNGPTGGTPGTGPGPNGGTSTPPYIPTVPSGSPSPTPTVPSGSFPTGPGTPGYPGIPGYPGPTGTVPGGTLPGGTGPGGTYPGGSYPGGTLPPGSLPPGSLPTVPGGGTGSRPTVPGSGTPRPGTPGYPGTGVPRPGTPGYPGYPGTGSGGARPGVPGTGPGAFPGAGVGRPGGPGSGDYEHTRRPGLNPGGFGPGGFDPDGPGARGGAGRFGAGGLGAGFGPGGGLAGEGFGPRGSGPGGTGVSGGPRAFGPGAFAEEGAGRPGVRGAGGIAGGAGYLQPAAPGTGDDEDKEHRRKYVVETDKYFADDRMVPPPVIGEQGR